MNINEIAILFGQLRQIVDPVTNNLSTQPAIEWLVSLSLPLPAAKNLVAGLKHTIEVYESRFGAIPSDPNQTQQIST
jgi:hypothetical protein